MSSLNIRLISVLMSVALIGIVLLQIYWIRHDYLLKEQQFDRQVQEALFHTARNADDRQALNFISRKYLGFESDSLFWRTIDSSMTEPHSFHNDPYAFVYPDSLISRGSTDDSSFVQFFSKDTVLSAGQTMHEKLIIRSDSLSQVTEIDHVRITERESSKDKMMMRNEMLQAEVEKRRTRLEQELTRLKIKLSSKVERVNEVMTELALAYATSTEYPLGNISLNEIDTLLSKELGNRGIRLQYAFGILDTRRDSMILSRDSIYQTALRHSNYNIEIFPNEFYSKGLRLMLYFPSKTTFVLSNMLVMLIASAVFNLTIIVLFVYTLLQLLKQKKVSEIKSDFINNMTHEFKTPIATIALAIDAINNPKIAEDKAKVSHYSNIIREENRRMNRQVETILQTAMFEKSDFTIKRESVNLHHLIEKAVENIRVQIASRGGMIKAELTATNPVIEGDELLLTTAIVNLLDNANKYSPSAPEITVTTEDRQGGLVLSIEDKGMGMDKETVQRIFDKFYRKSGGNIHDVKGFGLGLNHVKSIVTAHAGEISVKSKPGKGSCFSIFLPQKPLQPNKP